MWPSNLSWQISVVVGIAVGICFAILPPELAAASGAKASGAGSHTFKEVDVSLGPNTIQLGNTTLLVVRWFDSLRSTTLSMYAMTPDAGWESVKFLNDLGQETVLSIGDSACMLSNAVLARDDRGNIHLIVANKVMDEHLDWQRRLFDKAIANFDVYNVAESDDKTYFYWKKDFSFRSSGKYCGVNDDPDGAFREILD